MNGTDRGGMVLLAALLALGPIVGGWVLGAEIKAARLGDSSGESEGVLYLAGRPRGRERIGGNGRRQFRGG